MRSSGVALTDIFSLIASRFFAYFATNASRLFCLYGYKESIASSERHMDKSALVDKIKNIEGLTNDEKADLIGLLRSHKKYGLVWEEKKEEPVTK